MWGSLRLAPITAVSAKNSLEWAKGPGGVRVSGGGPVGSRWGGRGGVQVAVRSVGAEGSVGGRVG